MFYVDSQRTVTRRDSSLVVPRRYIDDRDYDRLSTARTQSAARLCSESNTSLAIRPKGSVQKELITMMFESMLDSIVESWEVIVPPKLDESMINIDFGKSPSELTFTSKKKKSMAGKSSKTNKRSRSKLELLDTSQVDPLQQCWWSGPDERAIIRFKNGNVYEGSISMKCMHGEGRFQWADGTVYLGQFKDNEMNGKGHIKWKDDTWYEGDFLGNIRHGNGLYVDSRKQRSYAGGWYCGTKHGQGTIYYSSFNNSYTGEWVYNVRHGFGSREYCDQSGYKGEWDKYVREGKGLMIWPNHDFYRGEWKNGVMSGYGIYIWEAYYNNSMSLPSISAYRGIWEKGERNGYGVLNLGLGLGSHYKGEFKNNKKHGVGKLVTNNGLILHDKHLFIDDNLGPMTSDAYSPETQDGKRTLPVEPYKFDICDDTVGLLYHIEEALRNIDKQTEIRTNMINEFFDNNIILRDSSPAVHKELDADAPNGLLNLEDIIQFEEISLRESLRCYRTDLKNIYHTYATICNSEQIHFAPVLIRLFLWQFYNDCNVHEKGLNLVEIDRMFHQNPTWLSRTPHDPFEKIYFWQFLHSLISVARKLYAIKQLPGTRPNTILARAFRTFMEKDVLPGAGRRKGRLATGYGTFVPLKSTYSLYCSLGEPHTVRKFLCAVRRSPHYQDDPQSVHDDADVAPLGRNVYIFGDEITYLSDDQAFASESNDDDDYENLKSCFRLFNFDNVPSKVIIKIFTKIFPQLCSNGKIMNLDIEITFFEFFEAFIACAEESIRIKDEEMQWREKVSMSNEIGTVLGSGHGVKPNK